MDGKTNEQEDDRRENSPTRCVCGTLSSCTGHPKKGRSENWYRLARKLWVAYCSSSPWVKWGDQETQLAESRAGYSWHQLNCRITLCYEKLHGSVIKKSRVSVVYDIRKRTTPVVYPSHKLKFASHFPVYRHKTAIGSTGRTKIPIRFQ
jgi:hypothetical protein